MGSARQRILRGWRPVLVTHDARLAQRRRAADRRRRRAELARRGRGGAGTPSRTPPPRWRGSATPTGWPCRPCSASRRPPGAADRPGPRAGPLQRAAARCSPSRCAGRSPRCSPTDPIVPAEHPRALDRRGRGRSCWASCALARRRPPRPDARRGRKQARLGRRTLWGSVASGVAYALSRGLRRRRPPGPRTPPTAARRARRRRPGRAGPGREPGGLDDPAAHLLPGLHPAHAEGVTSCCIRQ